MHRQMAVDPWLHTDRIRRVHYLLEGNPVEGHDYEEHRQEEASCHRALNHLGRLVEVRVHGCHTGQVVRLDIRREEDSPDLVVVVQVGHILEVLFEIQDCHLNTGFAACDLNSTSYLLQQHPQLQAELGFQIRLAVHDNPVA
jgi:hypothetical protein